MCKFGSLKFLFSRRFFLFGFLHIVEGHVSEQIEKKAKELGVWALARKTRIGTSGSSLDVKLPKQIADFLGLKKGQEVVIEPVKKNKIEITVMT